MDMGYDELVARAAAVGITQGFDTDKRDDEGMFLFRGAYVGDETGYYAPKGGAA